ncbi:MAG: hypothetical protein J6Y78_09400 [Paludibacteraceae bacterium]|nr:hypothetical protein [Paludibacteraceae bacterium]
MEILDNTLEGKTVKNTNSSLREDKVLSVSQLSMIVEEFNYLEILEYDTVEH